MIRHLTATGLTSTSNIKLTPNPGYRWRILSIQGFLLAGTTAGTRSLQILLLPFQTTGGAAMTLTYTGSQTGVSTTYFCSLVGSSNPSAPGGYVLYGNIYADASAPVLIVPVILSGDTYGYDIQVLEEPDI